MKNIGSLFAVLTFSLYLSLPATATELVLAAVPVTFTLTNKEPTGAVRPRDPETGKEVKGAELDSSTSFTITNPDGSTKESFLWGLKTVVSRIGNKEIIQGAIDDGLITGPVTGWSIKAQPTTSLSGTDWTISYAVYFAKNKEAVDWFTISVSCSELASSGSFTKTTNAKGVTTAQTYNGTQSHEKSVSFSVNESQVTGLFSCATVLKSYYKNTKDKGTFTTICVPGGAKITNVLSLEESGYGYTAGSVLFGASDTTLR